MVANFMRYYTRIKISHGCRFHEILHQNQNISCWRFHEILRQNKNISWLQISWDITPESRYVMVVDIMRYYARIKISHGCRFHEILYQSQNISWLSSWSLYFPWPLLRQTTTNKTLTQYFIISCTTCFDRQALITYVIQLVKIHLHSTRSESESEFCPKN